MEYIVGGDEVDDTKPFYYSKEFWTYIIVGIIAPLLATYGYNIDAEDAVLYGQLIASTLMLIERLFFTSAKLTLTNHNK